MTYSEDVFSSLNSLLLALFVGASCVELFRERYKRFHFHRGSALAVGFLALAISIIQSRASQISIGGFSISGAFFGGEGYATQTHFEGVHLASAISVVLFIGATLFAPRAPLVPVRLSRIFFLQGALLALFQTRDVVLIELLTVALLVLFMFAMRHHAQNLPEDERGEVRMAAFSFYQGVAIALLLMSLVLRGLESFGLLPATPLLISLDLGALVLASAIVVGLFPFHSWVVPFLGAPRSTVFLPIIFIQLGLILFFRFYMPIVAEYQGEFGSYLFLVLPVTGLVYAALLFFAERRLKRIPGYLYLSHVCLMAVCVTGLGHIGIGVSLLDATNVLIAALGLLGVCSLLTSRFGVRGVLSPTGIGPLFPELAVCYLVCVLSLVGFPGTLGFIEEEVMLGQGVEHHRGLVGIIAIALTLNGFSSFRLFARIFYGQPFEGRDVETRLSLRERLVIIAVLAALVINGLAPSLLVETLTELSS
jgi:NADH:ubiquinone oxidoreductase subunit 4 (subunit M)